MAIISQALNDARSEQILWRRLDLPQNGGSCHTLTSQQGGMCHCPAPGLAGTWTPHLDTSGGHNSVSCAAQPGPALIPPLSSGNLQSFSWCMTWQSVPKHLETNAERICKTRKAKSICPTSISRHLYYVTWTKCIAFSHIHSRYADEALSRD